MDISRNIFIHFETFGIQENSILASVSVFVDPETIDTNYSNFNPKCENLDYYFIDLQKYGLFLKLDMEIQKTAYHRTVENRVVEWWHNREPDVKKSILSKDNRISFDDAFINIKNFLNEKGVNTKKCNIWSNLTCQYKWWFSLTTTIKNLHKDLEVTDYLPFYKWKDIKTALYVLGYSYKKEDSDEYTDYESRIRNNINLNPLNTCIADYLRISKTLSGE